MLIVEAMSCSDPQGTLAALQTKHQNPDCAIHYFESIVTAAKDSQ